jgi:hypothetical protein
MFFNDNTVSRGGNHIPFGEKGEKNECPKKLA